MTVHMIRFVASPDTDAFLIDSYIPQWLTNHTAWEADGPNEPPTLSRIARGSDSQAYTADWRFAWGANSKAVLLSNLVEYTRSYAPWARINYHECDHDDDTRTGCSWGDTSVIGTPPEGI